MKKWRPRLLEQSCSGSGGGDEEEEEESLNKSHFSLHNCPLIFHKQQKAHS